MNTTIVTKPTYSPESIVRSFEYFSLSRSAYNRLCHDFKLPSTKTLTRLTSATRSLDTTVFIQKLFSSLSDCRQKTYILLIDEVYVKPVLQYHGGSIFGKALNKSDKLANTVLCFMVCCLFGGPKCVCKMLRVRQLDLPFLYRQTQQLISVLQGAGANLVGIICDGNRVNQAFFKMFDTSPDSPWKTKDDIFLLFDFVHLLKCIRNNWIMEKTQELSFKISDHTYTAKWSDIKTLHLLKKQKLVKLSKLSDVSVASRPIERQKVSTCLEGFCDETIYALKTHPDLLSCDVAGTTKFIQTFVNF